MPTALGAKRLVDTLIHIVMEWGIDKRAAIEGGGISQSMGIKTLP